MTGDMHEQVSGVEESAYAALVLGTRDYVRKCGFKKVVVGLSGGIDSALTAVIAVDALGEENVIGISMPSQYSSEGSITDARALAENLGICFDVVAYPRNLRILPHRALQRFSAASPRMSRKRISRPAPVADF